MVLSFNNTFKIEDILEESSLLTEAVKGKFINWAKLEKDVKFALIYKGSVDGFTSPAFHEKCDGKEVTLTLVKSHLNSIFGGFT